MDSNPGMRLLHAYRYVPGRVVAWRQVCGSYHYHADENGSRIPHCHDKNGLKTFAEDEYFIMVVGDAPKWILKEIRQVAGIQKRPKGSTT